MLISDQARPQVLQSGSSTHAEEAKRGQRCCRAPFRSRVFLPFTRALHVFVCRRMSSYSLSLGLEPAYIRLRPLAFLYVQQEICLMCSLPKQATRLCTVCE